MVFYTCKKTNIRNTTYLSIYEQKYLTTTRNEFVRSTSFKNSKLIIYVFAKVHERLDLVLDSFVSYDSDAYDHFWPTVLFRMVEYEIKIVRPSSQDFEIF